MKIKSMVLTAIAACMCFSLSGVVLAETKSAGTNCDVPAYGPKGSDTWRECYINSSIAMCSANPPQTFMNEKPAGGCTKDALANAMKHSWGIHPQVCKFEADPRHNYLPDGVTEKDCESDWGCYINAEGGRYCS